MDTVDEVVKQQIDKCLELLKNILRNDLLGVYIYGSALLGGLQKFSDLDLLAVSNRGTTYEEKEQLEKELLKISGIYAVSKDLKPVELTIVVKSDINPWQYPPKFDFLYGDWLRKDFEKGNIEPWPTKILPNLALVITQLLLSYKTILGPNPSQLLEEVPYKDFIHAATAEIDSLMNDIEWDTRNVLLTLARIWCTLETNTIRSKADASSWVIDRLPEKYKPVLTKAKAILLNEEKEEWESLKDLIKPSATLMIEQINKHTSLIKTSNYADRIITLA